MLIDLNARRAAAEAKRGGKTQVVVGDPPVTFDLVSSVPIYAMQALADNDFPATAKALLINPDKDWDAFSRAVTMADLAEIVSSFGSSVGESDASTDSSPTTGGPSGQTSGASTDSTSPKLPMVQSR